MKQKQQKKLVTLIASCLMSLSLSGCGFHPRSAQNFPPELKILYFKPERAYSTLAIELNALLKSMNVTFVTKPADADISLKITQDHFSFTQAEIVDATLPSTMTFTQTATLSIVNNKTQAVIATQSFSTTNSLTMNANQVYSAGANDLIRQELNHQLISLIYYWLISTNTQDKINHADQPKTAQHASR